MGNDGVPTSASSCVVTRDEVVDFLRRFGRNTNSFLLAYGGFDWFRSDDPPGLVAYVRSGRTFVIGGDPLCAPADTETVLNAFARRVSGRGRVALVLTSRWLVPNLSALGFGTVCVGSDPFFDLRKWAPRGDAGKPIRAAVNRATRLGAEVTSYRPDQGRDLRIEGEMRTCLDSWLATRQGVEMRFFSAVRPMDRVEEKRFFCAWQDGHVSAFVACSPLYARGAWLVEDIVRRPDAVTGATEWLIRTAFESLAASGVAEATLGLSPLDDASDGDGRAGRRRTLRIVAAGLRPFYNFRGMQHYKSKFVPTRWEPVYVAFRPDRLSPGLIIDIMNALIPGGVLHLATDWLRTVPLLGPRLSR